MSPDRIRPGSARGRATEPSEQPVTPESEAPPEAPEPEELGEVETVAYLDEASVPEDDPEPDQDLEPDEEPELELAEVADLEPVGIGAPVEAFAPQATPGRARQGLFHRLYYGRTHFDFVRRRRWWFAISGVVLLAGVISLATRGLDLSIDFVGGTSWTVPANELHVGTTQAVSDVRSAVSPYGLGGATITELGTGSGATIQVAAKIATSGKAASSSAFESDVANAIGRAAHVSGQEVSITSVGPSWGSEITNKAIEALIVFFVLIAIYISIFFEWRMALAAIVAVAHDVLVVVGIYSLTGLQVTPDTVVAVLTILGYSLYDTIVVFDRVRDNVRNLGSSKKLTISDIVNLSMNQTLARSINTSLVAILPILAVLVLGAEVLGAVTLQYFGFALLIGLTSGAYSSIFIASPLVAMMKEREPRWAATRADLVKRGGERLLLSPADIAAGILTPDGAIQRPQRDRRNRAAARSGPIRPGVARKAGATPRAAAPGGGAEPASQETLPMASNGGGRQPVRPSARPGGARPPARARRKGGRR